MTQENFQASYVIDEMRTIFRDENQIQSIYKDDISPIDQSSVPSISITPNNRSRTKFLRRQPESVVEFGKQSNLGLNENWKKNGLIIISLIMRFAYQLKLKTESMKYKLMTKRIYSMIKDQASDFSTIERYRQNMISKRGRSKLQIHYSIFKKQVKQGLNLIGDSIPVLQPDSKLVFVYQCLMIFAIVLNLFYVPMNLSFINESANPLFQTFPLVVQTIWIVFHFNIGFYKDQTLKLNRYEIAKNYLKTYFIFDLLIVIPSFFQDLLGNYSEITFFLKVAQLRRIQDQFEYNNHFTEQISAIIDLTKLIVSLVFITHCCACSWHFLGIFERDYLISDRNWLTKYDYNNCFWMDRYITSLYFSVITTLTVGYGDITPASKWEQLYVVIVAMILCGVLGYTITSIGEIFKSINEKKQIIKTQMKAIEKVLKQRGLNDQLQIKVRKYFQHLFQQEQEENSLGEQLMNKLTRNLEEEVMIDTYFKTLSKSLLLKQFTKQTVKKLCTKVEIIKYAPGDEIIKTNSISNSLIFLLSGDFNLYSNNDRQTVKLKQIKEGSVIGEQEFVEQGAYDYTLLSFGYSRVAVLYRQNFIDVLMQNSPEFEKFCNFKDHCIYNLNQRSFVGRVCEICGWTHGYMKCPFTFFQPDKLILLKRFTQSFTQDRCPYQLRRGCKSSTKRELQFNQQSCLNFMYTNKILDDNSCQEQTLTGQLFDQDENMNKLLQCVSQEEASFSDREYTDNVDQQLFTQNSALNNQLTHRQQQQLAFVKRDSSNQLKAQRTQYRKTSQIVEKKKEEQDQVKNYFQEILQRLQSNQERNQDKHNSYINNQLQTMQTLATSKTPQDIDLEFEVMQSYKFYFPQHNINHVLELINNRYSKLSQRLKQQQKEQIYQQLLSKRKKMTKLRRVNFEN